MFLTAVQQRKLSRQPFRLRKTSFGRSPTGGGHPSSLDRLLFFVEEATDSSVVASFHLGAKQDGLLQLRARS